MIREMTEADVDTLVAIGGQMHAESAYSKCEYSPDKCKAIGAEILDNPYIVGLVSEIGGEIVGFYLGVIQEQYFSNVLTSSDLLLYVKPEHRNGMSGLRLIKAYTKWAQEMGVSDEHIQLAQTADIAPEAVDRLYRKLGFSPCGTIYKLRG
jgi:GNAT superfamily N-acetyltransferase